MTEVFEYWFLTEEPQHGATHDFLEVVSQIAQAFDSKVAGEFVTTLVEQQKEKLAFLRVVDWRIDYEVNDSQTIKLRKLV